LLVEQSLFVGLTEGVMRIHGCRVISKSKHVTKVIDLSTAQATQCAGYVDHRKIVQQIDHRTSSGQLPIDSLGSPKTYAGPNAPVTDCTSDLSIGNLRDNVAEHRICYNIIFESSRNVDLAGFSPLTHGTAQKVFHKIPAIACSSGPMASA